MIVVIGCPDVVLEVVDWVNGSVVVFDIENVVELLPNETVVAVLLFSIAVVTFKVGNDCCVVVVVVDPVNPSVVVYIVCSYVVVIVVTDCVTAFIVNGAVVAFIKASDVFAFENVEDTVVMFVDIGAVVEPFDDVAGTDVLGTGVDGVVGDECVADEILDGAVIAPAAVVCATESVDLIVYLHNKLGPDARKPVFEVSDKVKLKPACSATEASLEREILQIAILTVLLSRY